MLPLKIRTVLLFVPMVAWGQGTGNGTTTFTVSQAEVDTFNTTNATQRVDTFSTELRARIANGPFLYDQTFALAFSDPQVQAAITAARNVLTNAGAATFTGPMQISTNSTQVNSQTNTVQTGKQTTQVIINTATFVGPVTVTTGNLGVCQSYTLSQASMAASGLFTAGYPLPTGRSLPGTPFVVPPGGRDLDTRTLTLASVSQTATTTNTFLTTAVYELDGGTGGGTPAVPVPPTLLLALTGLAGAGVYTVRRKFQRRN